MQLRRETGNRQTPAEFKPTYNRGPVYRVAHACFSCRRSFKLADDSKDEDTQDRFCPNCSQALRKMGRSFAAPKKTDTEQWKKVELLWNAGFRFNSYRSHPNAEQLPDRLKDVDDFIHRNPDHPFRLKTQR
jgi:hypothetical protein